MNVHDRVCVKRCLLAGDDRVGGGGVSECGQTESGDEGAGGR